MPIDLFLGDEDSTLTIELASVRFLLDETKNILLRLCKCRKCSKAIHLDFSPCSCIKLKRRPKYTEYKISQMTRRDEKRLLDYLCKETRREAWRGSGEAAKERLRTAAGKHTKEDILKIWDIQNGKCYFCWKPLGKPGSPKPFHKDHLEPLSSPFGTNQPSNIALTCSVCNQEKCNKDEASFWKVLKKGHATDWVVQRKKFAQTNRTIKKSLN